ncbi:type 1 glutamine amidotransferase [Myceligenerans halotolerans]
MTGSAVHAKHSRSNVIVWVADGRPTPDLDYGDRLVEHLRRTGRQVEERSLTDFDDDRVPGAALHVLTGGATSVNDLRTWMPAGLEHVRRLLDLANAGETYLLGVCLGSQMIAERLWPGSIRSADSIEIGLVDIDWQSGTDGPSPMPAFHYEQVDPRSVTRGGGEILAWNQHSGVQCYRYGERVLATQFHPELSPADVGELISYNEPTITEYGGDVAAAQATVADSGKSWDEDSVRRILGVAGFGSLLRAP